MRLKELYPPIRIDNPLWQKHLEKYFHPSKDRKNKSIPLPPDWADIRVTVIERDKVCQDCGGHGHDVHHIDRNRENNNTRNLVYLCRHCHLKRHHTKLCHQKEVN